jgi:hypothetical protein
MKIPLSDAPLNERELIFRKFPKTNTAILLANLLESENDTDYRRAATGLQKHLLPSLDSKTHTYQCVHPDWFDHTPEIEVDITTCLLCGYRTHCTLGKFDEQDHVEIISLDESIIPSKEFIQKSCFSAISHTGKSVVIDPFLGFSSKANKSRKLFLISQQEFSRRFPDNVNDTYFDAAIGYDWKLQQAIWPIDQLFLEGYEMYKRVLKFEIIGANHLHRSNLSIVDQRCFDEIAHSRGWLNSDSELERVALSNQLKLLFSRLIVVLKSRKFNRHFEQIALLSSTPNIDHPFSCNGTGYLHLAIRWMELMPDDLNIYLDHLGAKIPGQNILQLLSHNFKSNTSHLINEDSVRYSPRFPMISFISGNDILNLILEQPAGKVIDVIELNGGPSLLLIDSLGINLLDGWSDS